MCLQTQSLAQRRGNNKNGMRTDQVKNNWSDIKSARWEQCGNIISERPEQIRFVILWLSLHPPLSADALSLVLCSVTVQKGLAELLGKKTLYTADRIILFLQLVLRSQCDSRMNMLHHTGFLSKQTAAWQNFDGAIYWMCQNTLRKKKKETDSALFWALFKNWGRSLGFSGSGEIIISMCEDHLNVWPSVLTKTFRVCSHCYCSNNIPHWLCTITAAHRSVCEYMLDVQLWRASNTQAACNNMWLLSSRHDEESFEWRSNNDSVVIQWRDNVTLFSYYIVCRAAYW